MYPGKAQYRKSSSNGERRNDSRDAVNKGGGSAGSGFQFKCYRCRKVGHKAADCYSRGKTAFTANEANRSENVSLTCVQSLCASQNFGKLNWCIDSGATSHVCNSEDSFISLKEQYNQQLKLADCSSTGILGTGTATFVTEAFGETKNISLSNTLYVPDLRMNLLSVSKITDKNFEVVFKKNMAVVYDVNGNVKIVADRIGDLYYVRECTEENSLLSSSRNSSSDNLKIWHYRLGHLNLKDLSECVRNGAIEGVDLGEVNNDSRLECEICMKGKMTRKPFPRKSERSSELLGIIHSDVCGPMRVESLSKARYYVEFIDDKSRYCTVYFIKHKSEVVEKTKEYISYVQNLHNKKVKCLQSDNGTEYTNKEMDDFLKRNGILRRLTTPYCPEQNGVAERKNRSLLDVARCLLIQSGLPQKFWAEAINTANYIRNRCPTKCLSGKTPFEVWHGQVPDVSNFEIFGSRVFCLNSNPNKGKLDPRSKEGIFMGYSEETKGFRVWIPDEYKVIIARDVKFIRNCDEISENLEEFSSDDLLDDTEGKLIEVNFQPLEILNEEENTESNEENQNQENRRGRGRPKLVRTGARGRPRKMYNSTQDDAVDQILLGEVPMKQALTSPEVNEWLNAMADEVINILKNDTWIMVDRPSDEDILGSRIVLRNKYRADGSFDKRKARLVAQGFDQKPGISA